MAGATVISAAGAYLVGRVADQGLANFFGEATCRHGTNPLSWLLIHITGALPQMGGTQRVEAMKVSLAITGACSFAHAGLED